MKKKMWWLFVIALLTLFFSLFEIHTVIGTGMEPTIKNKSIAVFRKVIFSSSLKRGDIVLYSVDDRNFGHIGRIIIFPGEQVRIANGSIYIKNTKHEELKDSYKLIEENMPLGTITTAVDSMDWTEMPADHYLILKDDRKIPISIKEQIISKSNIKNIFVFSL